MLVGRLISRLGRLGLSAVTTALSSLCRGPKFLRVSQLALVTRLVKPRFRRGIDAALGGHLATTRLGNSPRRLSSYISSSGQRCLPTNVARILSSFSFVRENCGLYVLKRSSTKGSCLTGTVNVGTYGQCGINCFRDRRLLRDVMTLGRRSCSGCTHGVGGCLG